MPNNPIKMWKPYTTPELNYNYYSKDDPIVLVADSACGTGKTSAAITYINNAPEECRFIYITPFLEEIDRIKKWCPERKFFDPQPYNSENGAVKSKQASFEKLLAERKNIVTTHALFKKLGSAELELARLADYILVMDEVADVITPIALSENDDTLLFQGAGNNPPLAHTEPDTGKIIWDTPDYTGRFEDFKRQAELGILYKYNNTVYIWTYPVDVFKAFSKTIILTYLFKGQIQAAYYNLFNVKYHYLHTVSNAVKGEDYNAASYDFEDALYDEPQGFKNGNPYKDLITIVDHGKLNSIGDYEYALSKNWYDQHPLKVEILQKNTYNFFNNITKSKSGDNMWTTFKDYEDEMAGNGYKKGFVECNARATNKYREKKTLAYLINMYVNPNITLYFQEHNAKMDEDSFALSELIQWMFRSQIREFKNITIYLPSNRMRELLEDWLEE